MDLKRNNLENLLDKEIGKVVYIFGTGHILGLYVKGLERADRFMMKGYCLSAPIQNEFNG